MPLTYDDIDGSWGVYSRDWPFVVIPNSLTPVVERVSFYTADPKDAVVRENRRARGATAGKMAMELEVPYGSYVIVDGPDGVIHLRLETPALADRVQAHVDTLLATALP